MWSGGPTNSGTHTRRLSHITGRWKSQLEISTKIPIFEKEISFIYFISILSMQIFSCFLSELLRMRGFNHSLLYPYSPVFIRRPFEWVRDRRRSGCAAARRSAGRHPRRNARDSGIGRGHRAGASGRDDNAAGVRPKPIHAGRSPFMKASVVFGFEVPERAKSGRCRDFCRGFESATLDVAKNAPVGMVQSNPIEID